MTTDRNDTTASDPTPEQRAEWNHACRDLRMDAYYYGFDGTGERTVDLVLSAVAIAGKSYHHTESWGEPNRYRKDDKSYADLIQDAADAAAAEIRRLRAALAAVEVSA